MADHFYKSVPRTFWERAFSFTPWKKVKLVHDEELEAQVRDAKLARLDRALHDRVISYKGDPRMLHAIVPRQQAAHWPNSSKASPRKPLTPFTGSPAPQARAKRYLPASETPSPAPSPTLWPYEPSSLSGMYEQDRHSPDELAKVVDDFFPQNGGEYAGGGASGSWDTDPPAPSPSPADPPSSDTSSSGDSDN